MASQTQSSTVLLNRLLSLKEQSPLVLILDTVAQSSSYLVQEFIRHSPEDTNITYVSFETVEQPKYAKNFIEAYNIPLNRLVEAINVQSDSSLKSFVVIDSINYISNAKLSEFITSIARANLTVLATFHTSLPEADQPQYPDYPSSYSILTYIASSIFEILPNSIDNEEFESQIGALKIPRGLNTPNFVLNLINRRKSGRSLSYKFHINTQSHEYTPVVEKQQEQIDSQQLLKGLTTFNLTTSAKQQKAKESVELPYLEAQSFETGGAIVYEFEKDDDYDEEDPYEDPF
jgi:elongator complex protein 5